MATVLSTLRTGNAVLNPDQQLGKFRDGAVNKGINPAAYDKQRQTQLQDLNVGGPLGAVDPNRVAPRSFAGGPDFGAVGPAQPQVQSSIQMGQQIQSAAPVARSGADLASQYGNITYDRNQIEGILNQATRTEYDAKEAAAKRTEGQFFNRLATSQNSYLDAMRQSNAGAIKSGANAGAQNANALSALLGFSQQTTGDATQLAQDARALADQRNAAIAANSSAALEQANAAGLALGNLGSQFYAADVQNRAAELGYNAQIGSANTAASAAGYAADQNLAGTKYNADQNLSGQRYSADQNLAGNRYTADKNYDASIGVADRNLEGSRYTADQNLAGNQYVADRNLEGSKYGADQNLVGTKYNADSNLAGTKYNADSNLKGAKIGASAARASAGAAASAARYAANQQYNAQIAANNTSLANTLISTGNKEAAQGVIDALFPGANIDMG